MLTVIFNIVLPVGLSILLGLIWGKSRVAFDIQFVTRLVTFIGAPCLIISTINDASLAREEFFELALVSIILLMGFFVLGMVGFWLAGLEFRFLSLSVIFPNTGNMGLPLCYFAFGDIGLAVALIIFVTIALVHFGSGDLILGESKSLKLQLLNVLREPVFCATMISLFLVLSGWKLPTSLALAMQSLGGMTIPLMLITLGVSLSRIVRVDWRKGWLISLLRVPGGLLVALLVVNLFSLEGVVAKVIILQASMPSALFNYFFALRHQNNLDSVASGVVLSTLLSFLLLPFILWFLLNAG